MLINWNNLVLLALLSTAIHWFVARSTIMHWFWRRAKGWFAKLLACPACSGFWLGCGLGYMGIQAVDGGNVVAELLINGAVALVLTPMVEAVFLLGLNASAIPLETHVDR